MTSKRAAREGAVGRSLRDTALAILDDARSALSDPSLDDAILVHELRKALKRWRAWLKLVSFTAPDDSRRLRTEARDLGRAVAGPRDAQSALDALADALKAESDTPLPAGAAAAMRQTLRQRRNRLEREQLGADLRSRLAAALDDAADSARRWPLEAIDFDAFAERLTRTYRRARRLVPESWPDAPAERLHELRQRVVDLRYQLEFAAPLLPGLPRRAIDDLQRLRNRLGKHQDLTLLGPLAAPRRPLARWRSPLAPLVTRRQAEHVAAAQKIAERTLARPPKAFRKRLAALRKPRGSKAGRLRR